MKLLLNRKDAGPEFGPWMYSIVGTQLSCAIINNAWMY